MMMDAFLATCSIHSEGCDRETQRRRVQRTGVCSRSFCSFAVTEKGLSLKGFSQKPLALSGTLFRKCSKQLSDRDFCKRSGYTNIVSVLQLLAVLVDVDVDVDSSISIVERQALARGGMLVRLQGGRYDVNTIIASP
jgi:hypothetical protein